MAEEQERLSPEFLQMLEGCQSGGSWFFWIAALSLANTVLILSGSQWGFVVGLGVTQIVDFLVLEMAAVLGPTVKLASLVCSGIAASFFLFLGAFSRKGHRWAFITGMILYALDGALMFLFLDFSSLAFHGLALFFLFKGFRAATAMQSVSRTLPPPLPSYAGQALDSSLLPESREAA